MIPPAALPLHLCQPPMIQYAITDRRFFPGDERQKHVALIQQASALGQAQVDFLQLREKDLLASDLLSLARGLRAVLPRGGKLRLLLNGPAALAAQGGADGVHLPDGWAARDLSAARTAFRNAGLPGPILSVSAHTLSDVHAACSAGADLILFGPVFEKRLRDDKVLPGKGLAALAEAAHIAAATPLLALGGLTAANVSSCLAAGAAGTAAIRFFIPPSLPAPRYPDGSRPS